MGASSRWAAVLEDADGTWSAVYEAGCDPEAGPSGD